MSKNQTYKPDWTPKNAGKEFAVNIIKGIDNKVLSEKKEIKSKKITEEEYVKGVIEDNRNILARCITLIESNSDKHRVTSEKILSKLLPYSGNSIRIGISGVPGAGKSTLIEALGLYLIENGHKVAVLTIDPSSSISKGSILGDKTRMEKLSREKNCFIRPSPSGGNLGGVASKTRETITVCEAAGFDVIIIETVGVGQSEITVRSMVDFFLLIMIAGAGDELQGIKKGIIEISDAVVFNKADGDNKLKSETAKTEFSQAVHYLQSFSKDWQIRVTTASAINNEGISQIWEMISEFVTITKKNNQFQELRKVQSIDWLHTLIKESLINNFYSNQKVRKELANIEEKIINGKLSPNTAAELLLKNIL